MKALNYGVAFLLAFTIALCFAYKNKLQEANRYIEKTRNVTLIGTNVIRILDKSDQLVLLIKPLSADAHGKTDLKATNLLLATKHLPLVHYSNEMFFIRFSP